MPANDFVTTTTAELAERIDGAYERFAQLLAGASEGVAVGSTWTAAQVVGHVVTVVNRYTNFDPARLAATPRGVDDVNAREVASLADRSIADLLADLDKEMVEFRAQWGPEAGFPLDMALPFHGGATIDLQSGLTNLIGEFLVHGLDVASAVGVPWEIDARDGALLCGFASQILPFYVRQTNVDRLELRLDLDGVEPWVLAVDGATATSRAPAAGDEPDVVLCGSAAAAALLFYGRLDVRAAEAGGLHVVGGTRPELAASIPTTFEEP